MGGILALLGQEEDDLEVGVLKGCSSQLISPPKEEKPKLLLQPSSLAPPLSNYSLSRDFQLGPGGKESWEKKRKHPKKISQGSYKQGRRIRVAVQSEYSIPALISRLIKFISRLIASNSVGSVDWDKELVHWSHTEIERV